MEGVDFKRVSDLYRTFNFEIYLIEGLGAQCGENITIKEGKVSDNTGLLSWIANHSNFKETFRWNMVDFIKRYIKKSCMLHWIKKNGSGVWKWKK